MKLHSVADLEQWKLIVSRESRREIIEGNHALPHAGHLGIEKTYHRVAARYYWPRMFSDVAEYVRRCDVYQRTKVEQDVPADGTTRSRIAVGPSRVSFYFF